MKEYAEISMKLDAQDGEVLKQRAIVSGRENLVFEALYLTIAEVAQLTNNNPWSITMAMAEQFRRDEKEAGTGEG